MPEHKEIAGAIINILNDVDYISTAELIENLKIHFNLSSSELACRTKCDRQFKFNNRVICARTYLWKKGLISVDISKRVSLL